MRLCSIASGSSGNCIYVGDGETHFLIDAGISGKRIVTGLESIGVDPAELSGVFITHEHSDHIQGLGVLARRFNVPIYSTVETLNAILRINSIGKIDTGLLNFIEPNVKLSIGDFEIEPFSISHDAANPISYTFSCHGKKIGMATDLGTYDDYIISMLKDSNVLYLEANHDVNMLMVGSYPYHLKQRILGNHGHLSNDLCSSLLCELLNDKLKYVLLAHLSKENNYAELAYETVRLGVKSKVVEEDSLPHIAVANRDVPSEMIII